MCVYVCLVCRQAGTMTFSRPTSISGSNVPSYHLNHGITNNRITSNIAPQNSSVQVHHTQQSNHQMIKAAPGTGSNSAQNTPHLGSLAQLSSSSSTTSSSSHQPSNFISVSSSASILSNAANSSSSAGNTTAAAPSPLLISSHNSANGQSGGHAFNTELRAQLRREREATREKSREKLNNGHSNGQNVNNCVGNAMSNANQQSQPNQTHHHHQQQQHSISSGRDRSASSAGSGVLATNIPGHPSNEKKISPKMNTRPPHPGHNPSSHSLQNLHSSYQTQASGRNSAHQRAPSSHRNASGMHIEARSNSIGHIDTSSLHTTPELVSTNEGISSLRGLQDLIARIPSPPGPNDDGVSEDFCAVPERVANLLFPFSVFPSSR